MDHYWKSCSIFQKRHEKTFKAPLGGGLTMTSCSVGIKTLLSRKPLIAAKTFLWINIRKSLSLFQNLS